MKLRIVSIILITALICGMLPLINVPATVKAAPGTIFVPTDYSTISAAIAAANFGDTILVASGTYYEAIDINKPLNITSTGGPGVTFIDGTGVVLASAGLVRITAGTGDATFSGFTVQHAPAASGVTIGILSRSSVSGVTYTISYNNIYGTNDPNNADDYGFYSSYDSANVVFTHNLITQTGANNIVFERHTGTTEISQNTLDAGVWGSDAIFMMTYSGIDVTTLQNVSYNTFDMSTGGVPFDYDHRSSAISFNTWPIAPDAKFTNVIIQGNTINNLESYRRGIGFWNGGGNGGGTILPLVEGNSITGLTGRTESYGIDFIGANATTNATIIGNDVSNCAFGIYLRTTDCAPGARIYYNNIVGNTVGLDNAIGTSPIDAQHNWWGDPTGPAPSGGGDPVTANVNYASYLTSPVPSTLYIDPASVNKTPGDASQTFMVAVTLSQFSYLMGLDIRLTWDSSLISLVSADKTYLDTLWGAGGWALVTEVSGSGFYQLVASSVSAAATNPGASILFTVTFHADTASSTPLSTAIHFDVVKLSDNATPVPNSIPCTATDAIYTMSAMFPDLEFNVLKYDKTTDVWTPVSPPYIFEYCNYFLIEVYVSDVVSLTEYTLTIDFGPGLTSFQNVSAWGIFGAGSVVYTPGTPNVIQVSDSGSAWSGPTGLLFSVMFHVEFTATADHIWKYGQTNFGAFQIWIADATLTFGSYIVPVGGIIVPSALSIEVDFIRGDVSCDGVVNIDDIGSVAYYYGQTVPSGPSEYDLNSDALIDIYDIVTIATNFGYGLGP